MSEQKGQFPGIFPATRMYHIDRDQVKHIERTFSHHPPIDQGQIEKYQHIRQKCKELAYDICAFVPDSAERSAAITKVEEACFWANAGIARHEK